MNKLIANGYLIQDLSAPTQFVNSFNYRGIHSHYLYPLSTIENPLCRAITKRQQSKKLSNGLHQVLEFISDKYLLNDYINCCLENNVNVRVLFIESAYNEEEFFDELPNLKFIGYEYCPIPIDEQVVTDLDWYAPLSFFHDKLNNYGLFKTYSDANEFKKIYDELCESNIIGDQLSSAYILKVSEVLDQW